LFDPVEDLLPKNFTRKDLNMRNSFIAFVSLILFTKICSAMEVTYAPNLNYAYSWTSTMFINITYKDDDNIDDFLSEYLKPNLTSNEIYIIDKQFDKKRVQLTLEVKGILSPNIYFENEQIYKRIEEKISNLVRVSVIQRELYEMARIKK
jgi:hypothetical protein